MCFDKLMNMFRIVRNDNVQFGWRQMRAIKRGSI